MHECPNQKTIDLVEKVVFTGNGEPSLMTALKDVSTKLDTYMERQESLIKEFGITNREFYTFKADIEATDKEREKQIDRQTSRTRWTVGVAITAIGVVIAGLSFWFKSDMKELATRQDWTSIDLMYLQDSIRYKVRGIDSLNLEL